MNTIKNLFASLALCVALVGSAFAADKVNINTASASEMAEVLNGVGDSKAEAIVQHRKENGPFKSADQLAEVRGIGLKTVEKNRDRIVVGATPAPAAPQAAKPTASNQES